VDLRCRGLPVFSCPPSPQVLLDPDRATPRCEDRPPLNTAFSTRSSWAPFHIPPSCGAFGRSSVLVPFWTSSSRPPPLFHSPSFRKADLHRDRLPGFRSPLLPLECASTIEFRLPRPFAPARRRCASPPQKCPSVPEIIFFLPHNFSSRRLALVSFWAARECGGVPFSYMPFPLVVF